MTRIFFNNINNRKSFFELIKSKANTSWKSIATNMGTTRTMMDRYRAGLLGIPSKKFLILIAHFSSEEKKRVTKMIFTKESNWGQIIGGKKAYQINKNAFDLGRAIGGKSVKYDFDINLPLSQDLCEFLGVIIGDGCTNKYGRLYQTQITGDKLLDKEYYTSRLSSICKELFGIAPKISFRPRGLYLNMYSKRVFELLTKRFKIPAGIKCYTVKMPQEIIDGDEKMKCFVLRGMFNTDGGVGFDRRKNYRKPYVRVNYTSTSLILVSQISKILSKYRIPHSVHTKSGGYGNMKTSSAVQKQIQINREQNVKLFLNNKLLVLLSFSIFNVKKINSVSESAYINPVV